uniref:Uncharacterized protein n=1 Tax=Cannabis sativa TaxID=3483 RepID=A0A803PDV0_CANSA
MQTQDFGRKFGTLRYLQKVKKKIVMEHCSLNGYIAKERQQQTTYCSISYDLLGSLVGSKRTDLVESQSHELVSSSVLSDLSYGKENWTKPPFNLVKVNVDGVVFDKENRLGYGCWEGS